MTAEVGFKLRELRKLHGLTQAQLSRDSGIGVKLLSAIEVGTRRVRVDQVERICGAVNVTLSAFFAWDVLHEVAPPELRRA
jgi:transcriptional regulator with XRE-family HTH domain